MGIIRLNRHQYQAESLEILDGDNSDKFYVTMKIKEGEVTSEWKKDGNVKLISVNLKEKED